jgi:hypothetical protein
MLRAYYSQLHRELPDPDLLGKELDEIDSGQLDRDAARRKARTVIKRIVEEVKKGERPDGRQFKAWLVTDFVTFGSPLTYAGYLMCSGNSAGDLTADFKRRKREREFPTCPPEMLDGDGRLTFQRPSVGRRFHHGGLFSLTRWTNLYFPIHQLAWGDPIGGPVATVFAPEHGLEKVPDGAMYREHIVDKEVYTESVDVPDAFAHNTYWNVGKKNQRGAPHILAFREAIDLADRDA